VPISHGTFFLRLAIATVLGFLIGLERQWRQRTAGLHTATLVAIGAALFSSLPELGGVNDAMRIAGQVVTGVGFLAGGVIVREGLNVRGLITAATLWSTAAVGVLAGTGFEIQATVGAVVILVTNVVCWPLAGVIARIPRGAGEQLTTTYSVRVHCAEHARFAVRDCVLREITMTSLSLTTMSSSAPADGSIDITAELTKPGRDDGAADRLQAALTELDGVASVHWDASERAA
jgi:putative Mg2+ transporter-C (MgtC) family protein